MVQMEMEMVQQEKISRIVERHITMMNLWEEGARMEMEMEIETKLI